MATNSNRRGTGSKPASNAGKLLRNPKTPKKVKDVAASDLAQARAIRRKTRSDQCRPGPVTRAADRQYWVAALGVRLAQHGLWMELWQMIFTELDSTTRTWMLQRFEAEESTGHPYRSGVLSQLGVTHWPDLMREAIIDPDGSEITLAVTLNRPDYWQATETYVRNGVTRQRSVNFAQASERLAITEFNTWYVAGLAARLQEEGVTRCRVCRAGLPKWQPAECSVHEGQTYAVAEIIAGHRVGYWPPPGMPGKLSIPAGPSCHHTIERV